MDNARNNQAPLNENETSELWRLMRDYRHWGLPIDGGLLATGWPDPYLMRSYGLIVRERMALFPSTSSMPTLFLAPPKLGAADLARELSTSAFSFGDEAARAMGLVHVNVASSIDQGPWLPEFRQWIAEMRTQLNERRLEQLRLVGESFERR